MSVIIRLQNLPWSANAMDIRQFFRGLSIPEGGVHIVGGEMGDAFIAFSTDEDARQAMMHDRESIKEVQVRLLLSSRAEMQKVIEQARLTSLSVFQKLAAAAAAPTVRPPPSMPAGFTIANNSAAAPTVATPMLPTGPTPSFLAYQQQAGITLTGSPISVNDFDNTNNKSSTQKDEPSLKRFERSHERERERRRSTSRDRRDFRRRYDDSRSRSREREREHGRNRDRDRDSSNSRRFDRSRRSTSRSSRERDRSNDRSRGRSYNRSIRRSQSKERDPRLRREGAAKAGGAISPWEHGNNVESAEKPKISPWGIQAAATANSYQTNSYQASLSNSYSTTENKEKILNAVTTGIGADNTMATSSANAPEIVIPAFQNYTTSTTTSNYSLNVYGGNSSNSNNSNDSGVIKSFVLQNPYTTAQPALSPALGVDSKTTSLPLLAKSLISSATTPVVTSDISSVNSFNTVDQEPIAFAKTNPYEQMYPNLFAQAAAQQMPRSNATAAQRMNSPSCKTNNDTHAFPESSSIKITDMCTNTNYSDLRKFFAGLFIPHNGIKMVNDKYGMRTGVAYIQFSRSNSVPKALTRNRTMLKSNTIQIEAVPDEEFNEAEDGCRSHGRFDRPNYNDGGDKDRQRFDGNGGNNSTGNDQRGGSRKFNSDEPFTVLYLEELPPLTTEQDLMRMFSSYSLYDILLLPSAENRREYVAYVKFSLTDDAKAALEDKSKHMIGYRKVRVYAGKDEDMEKAKEKLRIANEQLLKEEQEEAMREAAAEAAELERKSMLDSNQHDIERDDEPVDIKMDMDMSMSPPPSSMSSTRDPRATRDPRLIPSLLEMAPAKPPVDYDDVKNTDNQSVPPADPRLRGRTRPSRFDNNDSIDRNATPNNETISNNTNGFDHIARNPANPFINMSNNGSSSNNSNFNNEIQMPMQQQQPSIMPYQRNMMMDNNFVFLYNCPYNLCQRDIADLFRSANMMVKHIEMLNNERGMPSGEFIVEVFNARDADRALNDFNNIQFHGRSLRVRSITPQGIADRIKKPFMNCIPSGGAGGGNGHHAYNYNNNNNVVGAMMMNAGSMRGNSRNTGDNGMNYNGGNLGGTSNSSRNDSPDRRGRHSGGNAYRRIRSKNNKNYNNDNDDQSDDSGDFNNDNDYTGNDAASKNKNNLDNENFIDTNSGGGGIAGIPEKFTRPNCVVAMGNVPYKADLKDILRFFSGFNLRPDDIVRRYNDDGTATSDARVAFTSPADAQAAYGKCNRKQIFNRTIYLSIL